MGIVLSLSGIIFVVYQFPSWLAMFGGPVALVLAASNFYTEKIPLCHYLIDSIILNGGGDPFLFATAFSSPVGYGGANL